tara:strand:+ start:182 stop:460 length:279 start_codon:yes stop_codon:yes gene_type:complete
MKHNIKLGLNKNDNTSWEELTDRSNYSLLVKENDIENKNQFIDEIIKEFEKTDETLIPIFKEKLVLWLETMNDDELENIGEEKLRDFICEMF